MDQKELLSAIEDKVETAKSKWQEEVDKKGSEFERKLEKAIEKLVEESKGFDQKNSEKFEEFKKSIEKDFDELASTMTEKGNDKKELTFRESLVKAVKEEGASLKEAYAKGVQHTLELKEMGFDNVTNYGTLTQEVNSGLIQKPEDGFHVRDILSRGTTSANTIHYPRALGKTGTGPAVWDYDRATIENTAAKPEFEFTFDSITANVKWLAGILRLPVEMLEDLPWMTSYLAANAPNELLKAEDNQLLNGNGTGTNFNGIINTAVAYDGTYTVGIERIIDAAYGQLGQANYDSPTDILLNPRDIVKIILNKSTGGDYNLPEGTVGVVGGALQVGGLRVNKTNQIAVGNFLVGDFRRGAQLVVRSAPQLRFFEQDRDNAIKNMVTVRVEERVALAKFFPEAFVYATLAGGT